MLDLVCTVCCLKMLYLAVYPEKDMTNDKGSQHIDLEALTLPFVSVKPGARNWEQGGHSPLKNLKGKKPPLEFSSVNLQKSSRVLLLLIVF